MDDFESKLKRLPLRAPSPRLDARVVAQKPERPIQPSPVTWRVPVWLAAAAAAIMALAGFAAGTAWRGERRVVEFRPSPPVTIQVIHDSSATGNPFDFTRASDIFPAGKMEATIHTSKGA